MRDFQGRGPYRDVIVAPSPSAPNNAVRLGLGADSIALFGYYGKTAIAQYYGLVQEGIQEAAHCFRGVNRPMLDGDDKEADQRIVVYSWVPVSDYVWTGDQWSGGPAPRVPMLGKGKVFVVLVKECQPDKHGVSGSIERWNWVREDPILAQAPVGWNERYSERLWSR